jgi:hypothetical protein
VENKWGMWKEGDKVTKIIKGRKKGNGHLMQKNPVEFQPAFCTTIIIVEIFPCASFSVQLSALVTKVLVVHLKL